MQSPNWIQEHLTSSNIETVAFFLLAAVFTFLEKLRPAREIDRWKDLKVDIFSFALAIVMNRVITHFIDGYVHSHLPSAVPNAWRMLSELPAFLRIALAILMADFFIYWIHRAQHTYKFMWRTHNWHHSPEQLYWFSGFRTSFMHSFIYNLPQATVPVLFFRLSPVEAGIGFSIALLIQFWEHTNFNVNIGFLKYIFITPAFHRVHHTKMYCNMNIGTTFSFWDKMFGTYINPDTVAEDAPLGLPENYRRKDVPRMLVGV